jgi:hypothetical protein
MYRAAQIQIRPLHRGSHFISIPQPTWDPPMIPPCVNRIQNCQIIENRFLIAPRRSYNPRPFPTRHEWTLNDPTRLPTAASALDIQHPDTAILFHGRLCTHRISDGRRINILIIISRRPPLRTDPTPFPKQPTDRAYITPRALQIATTPPQEILALQHRNITPAQPMPGRLPRTKLLSLYIHRGNYLNISIQLVL